MTTIHNVIDTFKVLGAEGGKGADSIIKAAMFATACVAEKIVTDKDAHDLYAAYREGFDGAILMHDQYVTDDKVKVQVSCFKTFMKAPVVKNAEIHGRALALRAKIPADQRRNSTYNGLVTVNRAQIKKGDVALTNAEIIAVLSKADPVEKGEMEKLEAAHKALLKLDDKFGGLMEACALIERRINALKVLVIQQDNESEEAPAGDNLLTKLLDGVNAAAATVQ